MTATTASHANIPAAQVAAPVVAPSKASLLERMFPHNMHMVDRVLRMALGLGLVSLVIVGPQTYLGFLGLIPIFTAVEGSCPLYTLFGFSTCKKH